MTTPGFPEPCPPRPPQNSRETPTDAAHWSARAACLDEPADLFYPSSGGDTRATYALAVAVCRTCPVRNACLDAAMATEGQGRYGRYGVWGGLLPDERAHLARMRRQEADG